MSNLTVPGRTDDGRPGEAGGDTPNAEAPAAAPAETALPAEPAAPLETLAPAHLRRLPGMRPVPPGALKPVAAKPATAKPAGARPAAAKPLQNPGARTSEAHAPNTAPNTGPNTGPNPSVTPQTPPSPYDAIPDDTATGKRWRLPRTNDEIRKAILFPALALSLLASIFWLFIASDRYVSEADILIQKTGLPTGGVDFSGFLSGVGSASNRPDQMRMRGYLRSVDLIQKLDADLNLRKHYSDWRRDPVTRLWSADAKMEDFKTYFLNRVQIEYDDSQGVLVITAQAYDPKTAQAIVQDMIRYGEAYMNQSDHDLVRAQVDFLEAEAVRSNQRSIAARQSLIEYQNKVGMLSPEQSAERIQGIVAQLEARRTALETELNERKAYLVANHPDVIAIQQQIAAVNQQIANESGKVVSPGGPALNRQAATFDRLQQEASFSNQVYQTTLTALEKGRIDAMRMIQKVSVVQQPSLAERSIQPHRIYNALVFFLTTMLAAGIILLLTAIIRDHVD